LFLFNLVGQQSDILLEVELQFLRGDNFVPLEGRSIFLRLLLCLLLLLFSASRKGLACLPLNLPHVIKLSDRILGLVNFLMIATVVLGLDTHFQHTVIFLDYFTASEFRFSFLILRKVIWRLFPGGLFLILGSVGRALGRLIILII